MRVIEGLTDKYGNTMLHLAAAANRPDLIRFALEEGVDPCHRNLAGNTAGMIAVINHHWEAAKLLMDAELYENL